MKIRCVKDYDGIIFQSKIEGLTINKEYEGTAITYGSSGFRCGFMIFNDLNEWDVYQAELFIPVLTLPGSAFPAG